MTTIADTERLLVREYTPDDLDDVAAIFADPLVSFRGEEPMTREQSQTWLDEEMAYTREQGTGRYAIVLKDTGRVVGGCGLVRREIDGVSELELGYHLASGVWGRGLATEAARICVELARARGAGRVIAFIDPANKRSQAVARRAGLAPVRPVEWFGRPHVRWEIALT